MVSLLEPYSAPSFTSAKVSIKWQSLLSFKLLFLGHRWLILLLWNRFGKRSQRPTLVQWFVPCPQPSTIPRWQLRPLGWHVLQYGLLINLIPIERWPMERYHGWCSDRWFIGYPRRYLCRLQASHVRWLHPFPDWGCISAFHGIADA